MIASVLDRTECRWTIGVGLPIAMILLDPVVFQSRMVGVGTPILGAVKPFCYLATATAVLAASFWWLRPRPSAFASGIFVGSAVFATLLGLAIFPFSAFGILMFGIGLLGFTPFLMAVVFFRAARVAFPPPMERDRRLLAFAVGVAVFLGVPAAAQAAASRAWRQSLAEIASPDAETTARGVERLRRWGIIVDLDGLIGAYMREGDATRRARIANAYHDLTGTDAAQRASELVD